MNAKIEDFRPISDEERMMLIRLFELNFPGSKELTQQLDGLRAKTIDGQGSVQFEVADVATPSPVSGIVAEARCPDLDTQGEAGAHVNVLLHVAHGKLSILEIYKDDSSKILKRPNPREFSLFSRFNP